MMHKLIPCSLWLSIWVLMPFILIGQKNPQIHELLQSDAKVKSFSINDHLGTPSFISFKENSAYSPADAIKAIKKYFDLESPANEMRLLRTTDLKLGMRALTYKHIYNGIPVEHSSYVVITRNEKILSVSAESYLLRSGFSLLPSISGEVARTKALGFVNASKYAWDAIEEDKQRFPGNLPVQQKLEALKNQYFPQGSLVIARDVYGTGQARLAYRFDVYAVEPLSRNIIFVDAQNGKILLSDAVIKHADKKKNYLHADSLKIPAFIYYNLADKNFLFESPYSSLASVLGSGQTRYAGTRDIYTTPLVVPLAGTNDPNSGTTLLYSGFSDPRTTPVTSATVYILKDDTRGGGIETYDMNGVGGLPVSVPTLQAQAMAFVDLDNNWKNEAPGSLEDLIRGVTSDGSIGADEARNDDYALDAHWGAEMVYDYWKMRHNRLSFDNQNSAIKSYVHYGPAYDNAFWNGSVMTYGDGSGTTAAGFRPLTSLDVCGHEIGHGICSFTSDLVYASESGAMNEGLSDVWGASVEKFAITNIDPALSAVYKPFSIGEQIGVDALRRMDNPKLTSNPDTYGGQFWSDPNCTPTLANDQCGVHNNSGVLNKWFYLLTVGSTTGSGPDAAYAVAGADDGVNDLGTAAPHNDGNAYSVTGIGFDQSEAITYLMEVMLTPNATFADARIASIAAARILYGECSQAEVSVTNAWYAVNVGAAYTTCTAPLLSAVASISNITEGTSGDCVSYSEYSITTNLTTAQGSDFTVNFAVTGGTAAAHDFELTATSVTYTAGQSGLRTIKLRVFADAMVEGNETLAITATSTGPALNQVLNFTIVDDDIVPNIGGVVTLINENFESTAEGALPAGWSTFDKLAPTPVEWRVRTDGAAPTPLVYATKRVIIEKISAPALPDEATYDQLAEAQTILLTPLINAAGLDSLRLQFTYQAGGEPACEPACDYGQLVYSYDGTNFSKLFAEDTVFFGQLTDAQADYYLPKQLSDKQFYLGFLWNNDANGGTSASITIDNFVLSGQGKEIETQINSTVSERTYSEAGKPVYFYSRDDGNLMLRIVDASPSLGCVTSTVIGQGNGSIPFSGGHRSQKVFEVIPALNPSATYTITLYFTTAELSTGFAGAGPSSLQLLKSNAPTIDASNSSNSIIVAPVFGNFASDGYYSYTYTFSGFSKFALVTSTVALPVTLTQFTVQKAGMKARIQWRTETEANSSYFEVQRSADGQLFETIKTIPAAGNSSEPRTYTSMDDQPLTGVNYYRLKMVDRDDKFTHTSVRSLVFEKGLYATIYPNPAQSTITIALGEHILKGLVVIINHEGQVVKQSQMSNTASVQLSVSNLAAGIYVVKISSDKFQTIQKLEIKR